MTIRVGLNLLWLRPGEVGGTETYIRRIVQAVDAQATDVEWHLFGTATAIDSVRPVAAAIGKHVAPRLANSPALRVALERTWLRQRMSSARRMESALDVIHHPGGTVPFTSNTKTVVTIHDLQPLDDPSNFGAVKRAFLARAIPTAVERADLVLTPSKWVGEQIKERFSCDESKVRTVSAFADPRPVAQPSRSSNQLREILGSGPIALYPAMTMRHKNHAMLFRAFAEAVRERPELQLVCVGAVGRDDKKIREAAAAASDRIHMLGLVSRADLDVFFETAETLVFPSRYEGFGLPVLEAQHAGLPVIASTAGALPEVAGDAARLLDPDDKEAWTEALCSPLEGEAQDAEIAAGIQNALRFSLETSATQQLSAYAQLAT